MGRLELALREIQHIKCQSREAQTIAKLFDEDAGADEYQVVRHGITHIDIYDIRQGNGADHRPQPTLETIATSQEYT